MRFTVISLIIQDPLSIHLTGQRENTGGHTVKNFLLVMWKYSSTFRLVSENKDLLRIVTTIGTTFLIIVFNIIIFFDIQIETFRSFKIQMEETIYLGNDFHPVMIDHQKDYVFVVLTFVYTPTCQRRRRKRRQ